MTINIHCINLDQRKDRWDFITEQFLSVPEINLIRFSAVEHKYGWVGCGLSHANIIDNYIDNNEYLIVIEDDCVIKCIDNFYSRLIEIINWLQLNENSWEIFNGNPSFVLNNSNCILLNNDLQIVKYGEGGMANFIIYNTSNLNTKRKLSEYKLKLNSYIDDMNRNAVKEVSRKHKQSKNRCMPIIDKYLNRNFICVTSVPFLTAQLASVSNIENKYVNYDKKLESSERILNEFITNCQSKNRDEPT